MSARELVCKFFDSKDSKIFVIFFVWSGLFLPGLFSGGALRVVALCLLSSFLFLPIAFFKWPRIFFGALLLLVGILNISHYYFFGVLADEFFVETALRTNFGEAYEFFDGMSWGILIFLFIWSLSCFSVIYILGRMKACGSDMKIRGRWIYILIVFLFVSWLVVRGKDTDGILSKASNIYPLHLAHAFYRHHQMESGLFYIPQVENYEKATPKVKTVVVVIGESATAHRWSLLGYQGPSTNAPLMGVQGLNVVTVKSHSFNTAGALPFMLTGSSSQDSVAHQLPSFLDLAKLSGYKTYVFTNSRFYDAQEDFYSRVLRRSADVYEKVGDGDLDEVLTEKINFALQEDDEYKLLVLHTYGSHPKIEKRYPKSKSIYDDAYDNSIHYTSELIAQWIKMLDDSSSESAMLIYASDHGLNVEKVGGQYIHGKSDSALEVPLLTWQNSANHLDLKHFLEVDRERNFSAQTSTNALMADIAMHAVGFVKRDVKASTERGLHNP